jgi:DNA-directed RNA polymerase alpha subunit
MTNNAKLIAELNMLNHKADLLIDIAKDLQRQVRLALLDVPSEELHLSVRVYNTLRMANVIPLGRPAFANEIVAKVPHPMELLRFRNFGRKSLDELVKAVNDAGYPQWGHK